jgi:hypothetical protein
MENMGYGDTIGRERVRQLVACGGRRLKHAMRRTKFYWVDGYMTNADKDHDPSLLLGFGI